MATFSDLPAEVRVMIYEMAFTGLRLEFRITRTYGNPSFAPDILSGRGRYYDEMKLALIKHATHSVSRGLQLNVLPQVADIRRLEITLPVRLASSNDINDAIKGLPKLLELVVFARSNIKTLPDLEHMSSMEAMLADRVHAAKIVYSAFSGWSDPALIVVNFLPPDQSAWLQDLLSRGRVGAGRKRYSTTIEVTQRFRSSQPSRGFQVRSLIGQFASIAKSWQEAVPAENLRGRMSLEDGILRFQQRGVSHYFQQLFDLDWIDSDGVRRRRKACWEKH